MINVIQNEDKYQITFPYDQSIIYLVKNVPGRRWVPESKMWTIPSDKLGFLINQFKGTPYEYQLNIVSDENIDVNENIDKTAKIPEVDLSKIPFYVKEGYSPYNHQLDFMKWSIDRQQKGNLGGFICCDEQGLGKSIESINLAIYNKNKNKFKHCLIVCCINSSKYNWKREIEDHTKGKFTPYILGSRLKRDGNERYDTGSKEKFEDLKSRKCYGGKGGALPYFIITNIESFRYKSDRKYKISDRIIELINNGYISMVIIDEVHKNVSPQSAQGKQIFRIKKNTGNKCQWLPMTGTPITKQPTDLFLPLKLVNGHNFTSYYSWCKEFCLYGGYGGYEIVGYKNIPKLKNMLEYNMIRRLKNDVLDLPEKIHMTEYVVNTKYQQDLADKVTMDIYQERAEILTSLNPLSRFLRLRQVNGNPELVDQDLSVDDPSYLKKNAKLTRLLELLEEITERGEKVVVFSNWVECLRTLYKFVSKSYKTCCFTGTMKQDLREKHKQVFLSNPEYKVMLGTIGALGTTHTLTSATNVIFYDSPWNISDKEQAEDRIHRIGTKGSVNIYTLVAQNTIDERVEDILCRKGNISKYIVDNKIDLRKNPDLFDYLVKGGRN